MVGHGDEYEKILCERMHNDTPFKFTKNNVWCLQISLTLGFRPEGPARLLLITSKRNSWIEIYSYEVYTCIENGTIWFDRMHNETVFKFTEIMCDTTDFVEPWISTRRARLDGEMEESAPHHKMSTNMACALSCIKDINYAIAAQCMTSQ